MSDLVQRLRDYANNLGGNPEDYLTWQAAARIEALEADFNSAAAASEYSAFWEQHHGDFDQFGNYVPYSQMDGDLRAAKARIEALEAQAARVETELAWMEERGRNSTSYGSHADAYEVAARHLRAALAPEQRHTTPEATDRKDWPKDGFINDYD